MKKIVVATLIAFTFVTLDGQNCYGKSTFKESFRTWNQNTKNKINYRLGKSEGLKNEIMSGEINVGELQASIRNNLKENQATLERKEIFLTEKGLKGEYSFTRGLIKTLAKVSDNLLGALKDGKYKNAIKVHVDLVDLKGRSYGGRAFLEKLNNGGLGIVISDWKKFKEDLIKLESTVRGIDSTHARDMAENVQCLADIFSVLSTDRPTRQQQD